MSPNLHNIGALLNAREDPRPWRYVGGSPAAIVFAAQHPEVGELHILDEESEYTIEVGRLHHTHFSHHNYDGESMEQQLLQAAKDAVDYVIDVLNDRVLFTVDFLGDRCIGASSRYIDTESQIGAVIQILRVPSDSQSSRSETYLWSGPFLSGVGE